MKSTPLLLNSLDDAGRRLTRIEATAHDAKNEAWLQELLYRHPELLPADEFDERFASLIPIGREIQTSRGPIDNLYVSAEGGITIVETKLWKNPEKHRTVVAQIIDYAKELATWDYDQLCEAVLASSRRRGETEKASLEDKVAAALASEGVALHEFQERLAACLSEGAFLLLIVGDRISPNIALLTKAIQSAPGLGFTLGLAEMQLYEVKGGNEWPLIVVPEVVGRTVEHIRGVVQVKYTQEKPAIAVEIEESHSVSEITGLDRTLFLKSIPKDLSQTYEEGMDEWERLGGRLHITNKMIFWKISPAALTDPYSSNLIQSNLDSVTVVNHKSFKRWYPESSLHDEYLNRLSASSIAVNFARNEKVWIRYVNISADDLRVILSAGTWLANTLREEYGAET